MILDEEQRNQLLCVHLCFFFQFDDIFLTPISIYLHDHNQNQNFNLLL